MIYCTQCGLKLEDHDNFCPQCGTGTRSGLKPAERRLSRPREGKKIAGVCAGFARYLDVDPTLVRIIWLAIALGTGIGFIAYIIGWIAMPKDEFRLPTPAHQPA